MATHMHEDLINKMVNTMEFSLNANVYPRMNGEWMKRGGIHRQNYNSIL